MTRTITTVRKYNDKGRVTKETRTETTTPDPYTDGRYWQRDSGQWWQQPIVSWFEGQQRPSGFTLNLSSDTAQHRDHVHVDPFAPLRPSGKLRRAGRL